MSILQVLLYVSLHHPFFDIAIRRGTTLLTALINISSKYIFPYYTFQCWRWRWLVTIHFEFKHADTQTIQDMKSVNLCNLHTKDMLAKIMVMWYCGISSRSMDYIMWHLRNTVRLPMRIVSRIPLSPRTAIFSRSDI